MTRKPARIASPIDIELGARIKARRKLLGMSQSALAEQLGITFQQVQKYEKGQNRVGSSRLQATAQILGTTPAALFGEGGADATAVLPEVQAIEQLVGSPDGLALNRAFVKIRDERVRRSVIALVTALSKGQDA